MNGGSPTQVSIKDGVISVDRYYSASPTPPLADTSPFPIDRVYEQAPIPFLSPLTPKDDPSTNGAPEATPVQTPFEGKLLWYILAGVIVYTAITGKVPLVGGLD